MLIYRDRPVRRITFRGKAQGPTGPIGPAGVALTPDDWSVSGTVSTKSLNFVRANGLTLNLPAAPSNADPVQFIVPQSYADFTVDGNGKTVNGDASISFDANGTPLALTLVYDATEANWFIFHLYIGQNPA